MAGVLIENSGRLREILRLLGAERWDCNWLITELECCDHCGWPGSEKWASETLFLTNRELLDDIELRNMQIVWGILSAVPACYTEEEVRAAGLPGFEIGESGENNYLAVTLRPQNPLAFLEIMSEDSTSVTVTAPDMEPLRPLFALPEWTEDAEAHNCRFHQMRAVADSLVEQFGYGRMNDHLRRNLHFCLWRELYHHRPERAVYAAEVEEKFWMYWKGMPNA